jgi:hypothetical protein
MSAYVVAQYQLLNIKNKQQKLFIRHLTRIFFKIDGTVYSYIQYVKHSKITLKIGYYFTIVQCFYLYIFLSQISC